MNKIKEMMTVSSIDNRIKKMMIANFQINNYDDLISGNNCIPQFDEYNLMFRRIMQIDIDKFKKYINLGLINKNEIEKIIINIRQNN